MLRSLLTLAAALCVSPAGALAVPGASPSDPAREDSLCPVPLAWKWLSADEAAFSYDGSFADTGCFALRLPSRRSPGWTRRRVSVPGRFRDFPVHPAGAENPTWSPDSTHFAYTRAGNLYVYSLAEGREQAVTTDGNDLILNGYASWVYYEEIFGRPSRYRAFWWSPDGRRLAFYRFDNRGVPLFPIYSPFGQDGSLRQTRYPKAGEPNPRVRIGMVELGAAPGPVVWADFDETLDQYFGTPFWGADGNTLYVSREPRRQNTLDLYAVDAATGRRRTVYHEEVPTWLDWCEGMLFGEKGLYMVRDFRTQWQQVYYLSYDGGTLRQLTDEPLWRVRLLRVDEKAGTVFFTAHRGGSLHNRLWRCDFSTKKNGPGRIGPLSRDGVSISSVVFAPDGKHYAALFQGWQTPPRVCIADSRKGELLHCVADSRGAGFNLRDYYLPQPISLRTQDSLVLPGFVVYPRDFDPSRKYPVHVDIYGGPDTPLVRDRWYGRRFDWWAENGIVEVTVDCRAAGHNGRRGLDAVYRRLGEVEAQDFVAWARWLKSQPWVDGKRIGVEGFSFGGTMTALLVMDHPEEFPYGIAGGGVYDWALYDTHYTERFMDTPSANPGGYAASRVIGHVKNYRNRYDAAGQGVDASSSARAAAAGVPAPVMLKLTHGTGDDNVHFQHTLQLVDALQGEGACFELMVYPDGMHGYHGAQGRHAAAADRAFWCKYLLRR